MISDNINAKGLVALISRSFWRYLSLLRSCLSIAPLTYEESSNLYIVTKQNWKDSNMNMYDTYNLKTSINLAILMIFQINEWIYNATTRYKRDTIIECLKN